MKFHNCESCYARIPSSNTVCPVCNTIQPKQTKEETKSEHPIDIVCNMDWSNINWDNVNLSNYDNKNTPNFTNQKEDIAILICRKCQNKAWIDASDF